jgi:AcrR family transcriptional regulator
MNLRTKSKLDTRKKILDNTIELLLMNGLLKTTTKLIVNKSGVSQGTLFLHFGTKENLFNEILMSNIDVLNKSLISSCDVNEKPLYFVGTLLDVISSHEDLLSRVYKDEAYLSDDLCKSIDNYENALKNLLLDNYRKNSIKRVNIVDAFVIIDAFLAQLRFYLIKKDYTIHHVSLIKQRKGRILKLYSILFDEMKSR